MSFGGKYEPVLGSGASAITESAPGFAVHVAEVEVDDLTGEVRVTAYAAAQDVGFAINPATVEGQIHGGVAQGIGWALYEGIEYDDEGQVLTASLMDYALPRASMIPPIDTVLVEIASDAGAYGSKGVGEPPAIPGPATVANAIRDAAGIRLTNIPMLPRDVLAALNDKES
jgi:CO/xanthine dehydrogenase Mo-binding subunit